MKTPLLLISENAKDIEFWTHLAQTMQLPLAQTVDAGVGTRFLDEHPGAIVLWDTGTPRTSVLGPVVRAKARLSHTFSISDGPIKDQPELFSPPLFAHHFFRRYEDPAPRIYEKLLHKLAGSGCLTLRDFFPEIRHEYSETITRSSQKQGVVDGLSQFLAEANVLDRVAALGANSTDELLMNAIFDAPWSEERGHYRRPLDRKSDFELSAREHVVLNAMIGPDLIGLSVADQFGSINIEKVVRILGLDFEARRYEAPTADPGAGLGIYNIHKSAKTLLFLLDPGHRTEAIVLLGRTPSYREFKLGFSIFSVLLNESAPTV